MEKKKKERKKKKEKNRKKETTRPVMSIIPWNGIMNKALRKYMMFENMLLFFQCVEPLKRKISVFYWEYQWFYIQFRSWQSVAAIFMRYKECCKRLAISALEMYVRLQRVVYSAVKQASFGTGCVIVWTQPEDIHSMDRRQSLPTAGWGVVQTEVLCVCWCQYNDALKSTLMKCLFTCQLTAT